MIAAILHCAQKEWTLRLRERWGLILWMAIPLALGGMITAMSGGGEGPQPTAKVLLADEDDSFVSGLLANALSQQNADQFVDLQSVERARGEALMASGEATALLIVPKGFGDAVLREQETELTLITNPAQRILPGIVEEFLLVLTDGVFYVHRVFGDEIKTITDAMDQTDEQDTELFTDLVIAQLSVSVNNAIESLVSYIDPPILDLAEPEISEAQTTDNLNFAILFFPGVVFMGLLFAAQGLSDSFWKEREDGTLRRCVVTPLSLGQIMGGKMVSAAAVMLLVALLLVSLGFSYHGLPFSQWLPTVVYVVLSGLLLYGLMAFLQMLSPSRKSASLITGILVFPMMMAGGSFFPTEAMPDWMGTVSEFLPNGFLLERLKDYLFYDGGVKALLIGLAYLIPIAALFWMLSAVRLKSFAVTN